MIGVSEESEIQTVGSAEELHEILGSSVGRLLRVRSITKHHRGDSYRGLAPYTELHYSDEIAELSSLKLIKQQRYSGSSTERGLNQQHSAIDIELKGSPRTRLDLEISLVEIFQTTTGTWKTIHRGAQWTTRSDRFERKESNR